MRDCGCRCHGHPRQYTYCCPECEPEAYDLCVCGAERYKHNDEEREGSPGGCESFVLPTEPKCVACGVHPQDPNALGLCHACDRDEGTDA